MKLPMMIAGNFEPNFSVKHMLKDVVIASRLGRTFGLEFGATDATRHGLVEEMRQGRGDDDYASLFRQYFPAGHPLKSDGVSEEDKQPRLAGIDEEKRAEPEPVAAKVAAENAPSPASSSKVDAEKASDVPAPSEPDDTPATIAVSVEQKIEDASIIGASNEQPAFSLHTGLKSETREEAEIDAPRGLWEGFWRRRAGD
jgi:hypothetical protein